MFAFCLIFYSIYYKTFIFVALGLIACSLGGLLFERQYKNFYEKPNIQIGSVIEGTVSSKSSSDYNIFIVKAIKIDGKKYNCALQLKSEEKFVDYSDIIDCKIKFSVESFETNSLEIESTKFTYLLDNDSRSFVTTSKIEILERNNSLNVVIRKDVKNKISKYFDNENVNLVYSVLFGDKSDLNPEIYDSYKNSGVAHILAVSGLHVGLIAGVLHFILKLFKCRELVKAIVITAFLILYCYLCNWATSVVRATIMFSSLYWSKVFFRQYDSLSSMGLAGLIICCIKPSALFSLSFLLSFSCIFGINMFYSPCVDLLKKLKIDCKLTEMFVMSLVVNFTISPVMLYGFKTLNLAGVLLNIFILPFFSFLFSGIFIVLILSYIIPISSSLLVIFNPFVNLLNSIVNYVAHLNLNINGGRVGFITLALFLISFFLMSKYNLKKGRAKLISVIVSFLFIAINVCYNIFLI